MRRSAALLVGAMVMVATAHAAADPGVDGPEWAGGGRTWLIPPVDDVIAHRFDPPETTWGSGHRGIDYRVWSDKPVRAAAAGRVSFAGVVGHIRAVTIDHADGLETTYSSLGEIHVEEGDFVGQGAFLGVTGFAHVTAKTDDFDLPSGEPGMHFGVKLDGEYVDPEDYLGPVDPSAAIHLAPLVDEELRQEYPWWGAGSNEDGRECGPAQPVGSEPPPPNDNVAVVIPGISSSTAGHSVNAAASLAPGLGYPSSKTYVFSYRGSDSATLHEPYEAVDTFGDLRSAGSRLGALLMRIARRHPGADVDLLAHSQGGLIARAMLEASVTAYQPGVPHVDHLVTYSTPHLGTPLAEVGERLDEDTLTGGHANDALSWWATEHDGPFPDPRSLAVRQLSPGSSLIEQLAGHDVILGTQVLALGEPHDVLVPATRARYPGKPSLTVPPSTIDGHEGILESEEARTATYAFLRDGRLPCEGGWALAADLAGPVVDVVHRLLPKAYQAIEERVLVRLLPNRLPGRRPPEPSTGKANPLRRGDGQ